jgi:hypothetical protein
VVDVVEQLSTVSSAIAARTLAIARPRYWSNENVSDSKPWSSLIVRISSISLWPMCRSATITSRSSSIAASCSRSAVACTDIAVVEISSAACSWSRF